MNEENNHDHDEENQIPDDMLIDTDQPSKEDDIFYEGPPEVSESDAPEKAIEPEPTMVPVAAIQAERQEKQQFKQQAEALQSQMQMMQQMMQKQMPESAQGQQLKIDFLADPEVVQQQLTQMMESHTRQQFVHVSRDQAIASHGQEAVNQAHQALSYALQTGDISQSEYDQIDQAHDPFGSLMNWQATQAKYAAYGGKNAFLRAFESGDLSINQQQAAVNTQPAQVQNAGLGTPQPQPAQNAPTQKPIPKSIASGSPVGGAKHGASLPSVEDLHSQLYG